MIRVLLVDDSIVVRRILSGTLAEHPDIDVVGSAGNGVQALERLDQLHPDIVILDIEMPVMDGLETLRRIRAKLPRLAVIMFSNVTSLGARATLDALALGATDYVTKPADVANFAASKAHVRGELVPKILALGAPKVGPSVTSFASTRVTSGLLPETSATPGSARPRSASTAMASVSRPPIAAAVIGVSTGGPKALQTLIPALPERLNIPVLVVQHMPPLFTAQLAARLNSQSAVRVIEAQHGDRLENATVYLAPGDFHMTVGRVDGKAVISLNQSEPEHSCRPAVDPLFRSASALWGASVCGVVMTGMGTDGALGCAAIVQGGGSVLLQDEASSVIWGMPGHTARSGVAHEVVVLDDIAAEIVRRSTRSLTRAGMTG